MNPALLQFLISQQMQNPQVNPMPGHTTMENSLAAIPQSQGQRNPLNDGTMAAMKATKQSMEMDEGERRKALGHAAIKFFSGLSQQRGHGPGLAGTLGAANASFAPAAETYREEENRVNQLKLLALQQQHQKEKENRDYLFRLAQAEEDQKQAERRFALQEREYKEITPYQREHLDIMRGRNIQEELPSVSSNGIDLSKYPVIEGTASKNMFMKDKKGSGRMLHELNDIEKSVNEYEKLISGSTISPLNPYLSKVTNPIKDIAGYSGISPQLEKERVSRKSLDSKLLRFRTNLEKQMKGGVLSEGMMKRFENKNALPSLNESMPDLKQKIMDIKNEIEGVHKASSLSLQYGRQIDPTDLLELENYEDKNVENGIQNRNSDVEILKSAIPGLTDAEFEAAIKAEGL